VLLAIIFLVSGGWKVLQPYQTGEVLEQAKVPAGLGTAGAAALGTVELLAAFLLLTPRYRRWGGLLGSALLVFFIAWVGVYYHDLVGRECGCFPIIKRAVGPGFFVGDGIMLLLGVMAWLWSPVVRSFRVPATVFVMLALLAGVNVGVQGRSRVSVQVPSPVIVDGKPTDLTNGKVFLFFFDPYCSHCNAAAQFMSKLKWDNTRIVAIPTNDAKYAPDFLQDTKLKAGTSLETAKLRQAFQFVNPPYGVALVDGHIKGTFPQTQFNAPLPEPELKQLTFIK
jgi:uncharacterized membrane protein YphA (DoxX/SURF4 family)